MKEPFDPNDMMRRKRRSIIMALALLFLVALFFSVSVVKMRNGMIMGPN